MTMNEELRFRETVWLQDQAEWNMNSSSNLPISPMIVYSPASLIPSSHLFWPGVCGLLPLVWIDFPCLCTSPQLTAEIFQSLPSGMPHSDKADGGNREMEAIQWGRAGERYKPKEEEVPLLWLEIKEEGLTGGEEGTKNHLAQAWEKWCSFFSSDPGSYSLPCNLHNSSTAICRKRRTAAQSSKLVRATEDHSWGTHKMRTKGEINQSPIPSLSFPSYPFDLSRTVKKMCHKHIHKITHTYYPITYTHTHIHSYISFLHRTISGIQHTLIQHTFPTYLSSHVPFINIKTKRHRHRTPAPQTPQHVYQHLPRIVCKHVEHSQSCGYISFTHPNNVVYVSSL